jgi:hypothetical protein
VLVVVIGAGPAGLMAAIGAAGAGARVAVLEKNRRAGRKLLLTAGGRCNVSHAGRVDELLEHYGAGQGRFLGRAMHAFSNADLCAFFDSRGLGLVEEEDGKMYPRSMRAGDVRRVLLEECRSLGVAVRCEEPAAAVARSGEGLGVETRTGRIEAPAVIVAAGGSSYPATGSTGDGCELCRRLGHAIAPVGPALVPVLLRGHPFAECAGIAIPGSRLTVHRKGKRVTQRRGDLLFTHQGLSGPGVIDLSRSIEAGDELRFSLLDVESAEDLERELRAEIAAHGRRTVGGCLGGRAVPARVLDRVLAACGIPGNLKAADLDRSRRRLLAERLAAFPAVVERLGGWDEAMVTRGGVSLDEIDPATMQSRLVPGLYVVGETLDVDGDTGGYNLQAAFSTGMLAGRSAATRAGAPD